MPDEKRIDVYYDGELFTAYIYPDDIAKPVLFPIITASGKTLTRGFPPKPGEATDHPHHVGHWFNYGDVNGLDFWNNSEKKPFQKPAFGHIEHQEMVSMKDGKNKASLKVKALWKSLENKVILTEETEFLFSSEGTTRIIDRITTLKANDVDVLFRDNKEGMIAFRVTKELELPKQKPAEYSDSQGNVTKVQADTTGEIAGNYISSEGITGEKVWGTRGRWVVLEGIIEGENVALSIIDHPGNVGYPTYWHARGYGLFSANPLGQEALSGGRDKLNFSLKAGESVTFKYRLLVHSGNKLAKESVDQFANEFAEN